MARKRPRSIRGDERRSGCDGALLSWGADPGGDGRLHGTDREQEFERRGFGLWAIEVRGTAPFIGFVGLHEAVFEAPFTPAVEVGWRLARQFWGNGYATEAGRTAVAFGFDQVGLQEILSFTNVGNTGSQRVMRRIGMRRDSSGDFDHPAVPEGNPIQPHVLYRIRQGELPAMHAESPAA